MSAKTAEALRFVAGSQWLLLTAVKMDAQQEAQSRSAAGGGAAEAGQKAVAELSLNLDDMEAEETVIDPRALMGAATTAPAPQQQAVASR